MTARLECKCGAKLDKQGRCPALCQPVKSPPPKYDGPAIVGQTHLGQIAKAVTS